MERYIPKRWFEDTISTITNLGNIHIVLLGKNGKVLFQKSPRDFPQFLFDDLCFLLEFDSIKVVTSPYPGYEWSTITVEGEVLGFIFAFFYEEELRLKSKIFVDFLSKILSEKACSESEKRKIYKEYEQKSEEIDLIHNVVFSISGTFNKDRICRIILDQATRLIKVEKASILLLDENKEKLYVASAKGLPKEVIGTRVSIGEGISGVVFKTKKPMLVQDVTNLKKGKSFSKGRIYETKSFVSIPIVVKLPKKDEMVLGVMNLTDKVSGDIFTYDDLRLLMTLSRFAGLSIYNAFALEELREKERLEREFEIARAIQKTLFPKQKPLIKDVDIYGVCLPAYGVGGDYYDFFSTSPDTLDVIIADVSGHGIGSSLVMVMLKTLVRNLSKYKKDIDHIVAEINRFLYHEFGRDDLFITLFYGRIYPNKGKIRYVRAGHNPPILIREQKELFLSKGNTILGLAEDTIFNEYESPFAKGDLLLLYTDGLVDVGVDEKDRLKDMVEFLKLLKKDGVCARDVVERILEAYGQSMKEGSQKDDIAVICVKKL